MTRYTFDSETTQGTQETHRQSKEKEGPTPGVGIAVFECSFDWLLFVESFWQERLWTICAYCGWPHVRWLRTGQGPQTQTVHSIYFQRP